MTSHRLYLSSGSTPITHFDSLGRPLHDFLSHHKGCTYAPSFPSLQNPSPSPQNGNFISPKSDIIFFVFRLGSALRVISVFIPHALRVCILLSCPPKRMYSGFPFKSPSFPPTSSTHHPDATNSLSIYTKGPLAQRFVCFRSYQPFRLSFRNDLLLV